MRRSYEAVLIVWFVGACTVTTEPNDAGPDASTDAAADADAAPADAGCFTAYTQAGCDAASTMLCGLQDACAGTFCGCDGKTFSAGCGFADKPFDQYGACEAGTD